MKIIQYFLKQRPDFGIVDNFVILCAAVLLILPYIAIIYFLYFIKYLNVFYNVLFYQSLQTNKSLFKKRHDVQT